MVCYISAINVKFLSLEFYLSHKVMLKKVKKGVCSWYLISEKVNMIIGQGDSDGTCLG